MHVLCEAPFGLREGRKTVLRDAGIDGDGEVFGAEDWERVVQTFCVERVHLGRHKSFLSSWKSDYVTSSPRAAEQCCIMYVQSPSTRVGLSWGSMSTAQQMKWKKLRCDQWGWKLHGARGDDVNGVVDKNGDWAQLERAEHAAGSRAWRGDHCASVAPPTRASEALKGVVLQAAFRPTAAEIERMVLAKHQLRAGGYGYYVAELVDEDIADTQDSKSSVALRAALGADTIQRIGPRQFRAVLPNWLNHTVPTLSAMQLKNWQWLSADVFPAVWFGAYGRAEMARQGVAQLWLIEPDVGWTSNLACLLRQLDTLFDADYLARDCAPQDAGWVHFAERVPRNALPDDMVLSCQLPVVRQSTRLLERLLSFYAKGWAYCEMTAPTLARMEGWTVADMWRDAPQFFRLFHHRLKISQEHWNAIVGTYAKLNAPPKLFHRLKF